MGGGRARGQHCCRGSRSLCHSLTIPSLHLQEDPVNDRAVAPRGPCPTLLLLSALLSLCLAHLTQGASFIHVPMYQIIDICINGNHFAGNLFDSRMPLHLTGCDLMGQGCWRFCAYNSTCLICTMQVACVSWMPVHFRAIVNYLRAWPCCDGLAPTQPAFVPREILCCFLLLLG